MNVSLTTATLNDAGALREYVAVRFGHGFEFGMAYACYRRGMSLVRRLARLTGMSVDEVIAVAIADANAYYA